MKENTGIKSKILFPLQLAESANRGFVKAVQQIARIINYDFHPVLTDVPNSRFRDFTPSHPNQRCFIESKSINHATRDAFTSFSDSDHDNDDQSAGETDPVETITPLFSELVEERLSAIRWISENKYHDALPMLESILLIEDDHQVYEEASNLVSILREIDTVRSERE